MGAGAIAVAVCAAIVATPVSAQADASGVLYEALSANLNPGTHREATRLPTVRVDPTGEATIVFAIRGEGDDADATREGALADTLTVLRTVYTSPVADQVSTVTVLGTFPFKSTKGRAVRENPVLRAALSASRASDLTWDSITPDSLTTLVDDWWVQSAFANAGIEQPAPVAPAGPVNIARAHLDETIDALATGDTTIARSQFKQFFDVWDELDPIVSDRYPVQYADLDLQLDRAEIAILHRQPLDVAAAHDALITFRVQLTDLDLR